MRGPAKIVLILSGLGLVSLVVLFLAAARMRAWIFYPDPGPLPAIVAESTEALLVQLQRTLEAKTPELARHLQPGLTDEQIGKLETAGGFKLPEDIRALYRWHNGQAPESPHGLLPGMRFLPLEQVATERALLQQQVADLGPGQRLSHWIFAGHRQPWIHILDDGSSDGYFVDPSRRADEGPFFYNLAEAGYVAWFPSLRNFLAALIRCYEMGGLQVSQDGKSLVEDQERTGIAWRKFGSDPERER